MRTKELSPFVGKTTVSKNRKKARRGRGLNRSQKQDVVGILQQRFKPELKHHDNFTSTSSLPVSIPYNFGDGNIYELTDIPQGVLDTNRIGDKVNLESIYIKLRLLYDITGNTVWNMVRVVIAQCTQDTGAYTPVLSDILQTPSTAINTRDILCPKRVDLSGRWRVLYDQSFTLDQRNCLQHYEEIFINTRFKKQIEYTESGTTGLNKCYIFLLSDSDGITYPGTGYPLFHLHSRVRFYDL